MGCTLLWLQQLKKDVTQAHGLARGHLHAWQGLGTGVQDMIDETHDTNCCKDWLGKADMKVCNEVAVGTSSMVSSYARYRLQPWLYKTLATLDAY